MFYYKSEYDICQINCKKKITKIYLSTDLTYKCKQKSLCSCSDLTS